jgi:transcription elongation factor S-II
MPKVQGGEKEELKNQ